MSEKNILLTPMKIGTMEVKNRFVVPSMVTNYCNPDGTSTDKMIAYHAEKARGGWGLIITEAFKITADCGGYHRMGGLWADYQIASHKRLTDAVHAAGGKIAVQLIHGGRQVAKKDSGVIPLAPSAIKDPTIPDIPHEMTVEEIADMVQQFTNAAVRAKKAGFDGVEVHAAHGYLLNEFLSPFSNKRTDEYGGNIYGRAKFLVEVLQSIRKALGNEYPVWVRLSVREYVTGGLDLPESQIIAKLAQEAGADAIHSSQGVYKSAYVNVPPFMVPPGAYQDNAAAIKQAVTIPVIAVGRINTPEIAEQIIRNGKADFVAMGRASLADPQLPRKLAEGKRTDIQQCIGCLQGCIGGIESGGTVRCIVNPKTGMETVYTQQPNWSGKTVFVAGGGISGCQAAVNMAKAGANVHLYESGNKLGGQWNAAAVPLGKTEFTTLVIWLQKQLRDHQVTIHLNTRLDESIIEQGQPDLLVVATGGIPNHPPIQGLETTLEVNDVLLGKCPVGETIAVLGGGLAGAEAAEHLAYHNHQVLLLEMTDKIARDGEPNPNHFLMKNLRDFGVQIYTEATVRAVTANSVTFEQKGQMQTVSVDSVVKATGTMAYQPFSESCLAKIPQVIILGDAAKAKNGLKNLQEAFDLTWNIAPLEK